MQYKIIVDKHSRTNPTADKREYVIDIEELRCKGDVYDSLIITPEEDYVMRRLSLSKYDVLSILEEPIKETIEDVKIELFDGDNYIYLVDMVGNRFYAEYLINNDFNNTFATRGEMNSAITQTAQSIELSVNQKFTGYSTTQEMNSAINVKAGEITSSVASTYETKTGVDTKISTAKSEIKQTTDGISTEVSKKVGNNEVISKINQSSESVGIEANKIELSANDILNLLAGNAINLTSQNITISSTNFSVDKDGKMSCKNADIKGKITIGGTEENPEFIATDGSDKTSIFPLGLLNETNGRYAAVQNGSLGVGEYSSSSMTSMGGFSATGIQNLAVYNNTTSSSANMVIDNAGYFHRATGSSKRWKTDITEKIEERLNPQALYQLPIKQFKYKNGYLKANDVRKGKNILGFIAEDVKDVYEPAVQYNEDGEVEMWNSDVMIPAILKLVQEQHQQNEELKERVARLEGKNHGKS